MKNYKIPLFLFLFTFLLACSKSNNNGGDLNGQKAGFTLIQPFTSSLSGVIKTVSKAEKYEVGYAISVEGDFKFIEVVSNNFTINNLIPTTNYYLKIRSSSDSKWSEWSDVKLIKTADFSLSIETYNILSSSYDSQFPGHEWSQRRLAFKDIILQQDNFPDVLGIQEGFVNSQINDVASLLNQQYVGHISSREITARAIFWKKNKYSLVEYDDNIMGYDNTISGHTNSRYITYVRLKDNATGKSFLVFNIHPVAGNNAEASMARGVQARLVADKARELSAKYDEPAFVIGDYNNYVNSIVGGYKGSTVTIKESGFVDTFDAAGDNKENSDYSTHDNIMNNTITIGENGSKRLDYIFFYPQDRVTVSDYKIVLNLQAGSGTVFQQPRPSDHSPVRSTVHLLY